MMKQNLVKAIFAMIVIAGALSACVKDKFRYYGYEDQLEGSFPVDYIDPGHDWTLTTLTNTFIKGTVPNAKKLLILSGNPFEASNVEILAEAFTSSSISKNMTYLAPSHISSIYVAVLDEDGKYLSLKKGNVGGEITISKDVPTGTVKNVVPQKIYYGYEANYPNPGDWDYNDIVLTMTKELTSETTVDVQVTLTAVGYLSQIGAAIRWVGKQYDAVKDNVEREESSTFMNAPDQPRLFFSGEWTDFQKSRSGEFVINLFDDAHLAMYHLASDGSVIRRYFNTMTNPGSTGANRDTKTVTYTFTFDNEYEARNFTLAELDPFIIVRYGTSGSNFWEVHTYPYKLDEVLYPYYNGAADSYDNGFSWAVAIPYAKFLYPEEDFVIGEYKNSIISGAYQKSKHSFGEWILDRTDSRDWFLYPADGAVFRPL
jgi:LruC domain-containing protein